MFSNVEVILSAIGAGVLAAAALSSSRWGRQHSRFLSAGVATGVGFGAWYAVLSATHAAGFNTDAPIVALSWADAGSGVVAFVATTLTLGLVTGRAEPASRVVGAAAVCGAIAMILDIFVV